MSIFIGELKDAGFVGAVLAFNAIIGSDQEGKTAEQRRHTEAAADSRVRSVGLIGAGNCR